MTVVDALGALTISVRIEPEQDADDLCPLRFLFGRVEKSNVEREVFSIIVRQAGALWWLIVKRDVGHCAGPILVGYWMASNAFNAGAGMLRETPFSIRIERWPRQLLLRLA